MRIPSYHYPPYIAVVSSFACFPPSPISLPTPRARPPQRQQPCRAAAAERNTLCLLQLMIMYFPAADATASLTGCTYLSHSLCGCSDDYGGILFDVPRNGATLKMQIGPYREPTQPALHVGSLLSLSPGDFFNIGSCVMLSSRTASPSFWCIEGEARKRVTNCSCVINCGWCHLFFSRERGSLALQAPVSLG